MLTLENRTKIVAALRSGEYKQAKFQLYDKLVHGYCCIGVAAKVCGLDIDEENNHSTFGVAFKLGFDEIQTCDLVAMNDGMHQKPFPFIANVIEKFPVAEQQVAA